MVAAARAFWHPGIMDQRVARQAAEAGGDALWRALQPLRSTATWLMFGAHPDDEWNAFLAWLVLGPGHARGVRLRHRAATVVRTRLDRSAALTSLCCAHGRWSARPAKSVSAFTG